MNDAPERTPPPRSKSALVAALTAELALLRESQRKMIDLLQAFSQGWAAELEYREWLEEDCRRLYARLDKEVTSARQSR